MAKQSYLEQVAAAKSPKKRAALKRRTAAADRAPAQVAPRGTNLPRAAHPKVKARPSSPTDVVGDALSLALAKKTPGKAGMAQASRKLEASRAGMHAKKLKTPPPERATAGISALGDPGAYLEAGKTAVKYSGRILKDFRDLPVNTVRGVYDLGDAGVQAAKGDNKKLKAIGKGIKEHDPIVLTARAAAKLAMGDTKGAGKTISNAGKEIEAHPGNFLIEVVGTKGALGKGITRGQKATGKAIPTRAPAKVPHSNIEVPRPYSQDAIKRHGQVRRETKRVAEAAKLRKDADALEAHDKTGEYGGGVAELRRKANAVDPTRGGGGVRGKIVDKATGGRTASGANKLAKTRAARTSSVQGAISEANQAAISKAGAQAVRVGDQVTGRTKIRRRAIVGHEPTAAVVLSAKNVARSLPELKAERARVAKGLAALPEHKAESARAHLEQLDAAITSAHPDADVNAAAARYKALQDPLQAKLHEAGVVSPEQTRKAAEIPAAMARRADIEPGKKGPKYVKVPGQARVKVTGADLAAHRERAGLPEPAFVSERPAGTGGAGGGGRNLSNPKPGGGRRTGAAARQGTSDASPSILTRTLANSQRLADLSDHYRYKLKEAGAGVNMPRDKAVKHAEVLSAKEGIPYIAVPREPFKGNQALADTLSSDPHSLGTQKTIHDQYAAALDPELSGHMGGGYDIMPKAYADELSALSSGALSKNTFTAVQKTVSSAFRRTVLATSPSWLAGNVVEGGLRSLLYGVQRGDAKAFRAEVDKVAEYDPQLAKIMRETVNQGGHYMAAHRMVAERGHMLEYLDASSPQVQQLGSALHALGGRPTAARAVKAWDDYTHFMFNQVNGKFETKIRAGMAGAAMRKQGLMDPKILDLSHKAMDDSINGRHNTNTVAALGEELAKAYGRYDGYTSGTMTAIRLYTPFLAWSINATKFVTRTLPKDHPTALALMAASRNATMQFDEEDLPDFLAGSIPTGGGKHLNLARYTPFGLFMDIGGNARSLILPQYMSAALEASGRDWKFKERRGDDGKPISQPERIPHVAWAFFGGTVPVISRATRIYQDPDKGLNPFHQIEPGGAKGGGSNTPSVEGASSASAGGGVDWGGYEGAGAAPSSGTAGSGVDWGGYK